MTNSTNGTREKTMKETLTMCLNTQTKKQKINPKTPIGCGCLASNETLLIASKTMTNSTKGTRESIPMDLIIEILSNFPAKSVVRLRCLSKLWASTLSRPYFTELFLTKSPARPHLLFAVNKGFEWRFYTSPQPQRDDNSSLAAVDLRMGLSLQSNECMSAIFSPVSGLILCSRYDISSKRTGHVICNPTTGQYVSLPILTSKRVYRSFFGYDPIGKQYKILCMEYNYLRGEVEVYHLLSFNCEKKSSWRSIQCPTRHGPLSSGICINGILYYVGRKEGGVVMVCFDVRSEKFKFLDEPQPQSLSGTYLTNFKGKLVSIRWCALGSDSTKSELCLWVLEDDKKEEWSKHVYRLSLAFDHNIYVVGMIGTSEIVLSMKCRRYKSYPFYVFYFNPKRNTLRKVEIQGIEASPHYSVQIFLNHVENVSFITS